MSSHRLIASLLLAVALAGDASGSFLPTTVTLVPSPSPSVFGQPVMLQATLTPSSAIGLVTFYDGTSVLGEAALVAGVAQTSTILLRAGGPRALRAYFAGDLVHPAGTSPIVAHTVNATNMSSFKQTRPLLTSAYGLSTPVVGDFNGDGKADVALVAANGSVNVLLGDGAGGLTAAAGSATGVGSSGVPWLAVGDFNGDGKLDLAVVNRLFNTGAFLYVFLGDGSGGLTVTAGSPYAVGAGIGEVVVGDFDGDGKPDLAVSNVGTGAANEGTLYIFLGTGTGAFTSPSGSPFHFSTLPQLRSLVVADFNGDGKPDLAVTSKQPNNSFTAAILIGDGTGQFSPSVTVPVSLGLTTGGLAIVAHDFNRDGKADFAVALDAGVAVMLGDGGGGFSAASGSPFASRSSGSFTMHAGDFNGDGVADLILGGPLFDPPHVQVMLGSGTGSFALSDYLVSGQLSQQSGDSRFIAIGDFNGDGRPDVVNAGTNPPGEYILLGAATARIDIDVNGQTDALTDGLMILRYLFGLTGPSVTAAAIGPNATRTDPGAIQSYLAGIRSTLDVDQNGQVDALTDGLLLVRYLFGLRGNSLIAGAVGSGAMRGSAAQIETYIQTLLQ